VTEALELVPATMVTMGLHAKELLVQGFHLLVLDMAFANQLINSLLPTMGMYTNFGTRM